MRSALVFDAVGACGRLQPGGSGDGLLALARSLLGAANAMTCNLTWLCLRLLYDDEVVCYSPAQLRPHACAFEKCVDQHAAQRGAQVGDAAEMRIETYKQSTSR